MYGDEDTWHALAGRLAEPAVREPAHAVGQEGMVRIIVGPSVDVARKGGVAPVAVRAELRRSPELVVRPLSADGMTAPGSRTLGKFIKYRKIFDTVNRSDQIYIRTIRRVSCGVPGKLR